MCGRKNMCMHNNHCMRRFNLEISSLVKRTQIMCSGPTSLPTRAAWKLFSCVTVYMVWHGVIYVA